ncbi:hypothetical protein MMC25_005259 [Agyrium rufum]|nr:hypothetical protein [Agyrium rufum]
MPGPSNTLLIDGSFEELTDELAHYLDELKTKQGDDGADVQSEVAPLLEQGKMDLALRKLVTASSILNSAPEKEFLAAYNLLIHLVRQSSQIDSYLSRLCQYLSQPITSSPQNGPGLALSVLTTIFNILATDDETRFHVFQTILRLVRQSSTFDQLKPQLASLDAWLAAWESEEEERRQLYLMISDLADDASESTLAYVYLLKAIRTFPSDDSSSPEARNLALKALQTALGNSSHYDFSDLTALDAIQALRRSDPTHFELLEIFSADALDEYNDFRESHASWVEDQGLPTSVLERKMRLLTLASLAAASSSRSLPYSQIATALQIPDEEVEMWVIDVIRAGLVEGKLSQLQKTFLIHRSTYRVFGDKQWVEVAGRLDTWRGSLESVLAVVRAEREKVTREQEREAKEAVSRSNGATASGNTGGPRRGYAQAAREVDLAAD